MNANKKRLEDELIKQHPTVISDFTAEEEKKILKGEITYEEAAEIISEKYKSKKQELEEENSLTGEFTGAQDASSDAK